MKLTFATILLAANCTSALAQNLGTPSKAAQITVYGEAAVEVRPDLATLSLGVVSEKPTVAEAVSENAQATAATIDLLKASGIAPKDIRTVSLFLSPIQTRDRSGDDLPPTSHVSAYQATNLVQVVFRNVDDVGNVVGRVVRSGTNTYRGLTFDITDREAKTDSIRGLAVANAKKRAALYAHGASMKLGRLISIAPQARQFSGAAPAGLLSSGPQDAEIAVLTEAGLQKIQERVSVIWELIPE